MAQLGKLLGHEDRVHFKGLRGGSTVLACKIEREAEPKVQQRLSDLRISEAANDAVAAQKELNEMLREDNAVAEFRHYEEGQITSAVMARFPGREIPVPKKLGPISEPTSFKGELIRIEGEDSTKHAGIKDSLGRIFKGEMSRDLAIQMRELLFEWVQVDGTGKWLREEDGTWQLKNFRIERCVQLSKEGLADDINALRKVEGSEWRELNDPLEFIRDMRSDGDEIH
jgi:hypothetical protein